ncbi:MAG: helix-turn-helix domain-containing protein [bacterium]
MTQRGKGGFTGKRSEGKYLPEYTKARKGLGYNRKVRLFTVREAAIILRHGVKWIQKQIRSGKMSAVKFGKSYFIHSFEVNRWMGNNPRGSMPLFANKNAPKHRKAKRNGKTAKATKEN